MASTRRGAENTSHNESKFCSDKGKIEKSVRFAT